MQQFARWYTPAVIALAVALEYLGPLQAAAHAHEQTLLAAATARLKAIPGLVLVGEAAEKVAILSFNITGGHPHDIGTLLDADGIAIRTGHHCAQPVMQRFRVPATSRASFAFYNTLAEVDALVASVKRVQTVFS